MLCPTHEISDTLVSRSGYETQQSSINLNFRHANGFHAACDFCAPEPVPNSVTIASPSTNDVLQDMHDRTALR
jgi:hypothetical protein